MFILGVLALFLQSSPQIKTIEVKYEATLIKNAIKQVDSIARWSKVHKVETGACVSKFHVSVARDGVYTFVIESLSNSNIFSQDSMTVNWNDFCGDSLPSLHTHLLYFDAILEPSEVDWKTTSVPSRSKIPFELLIILNQDFVLFDILPYNIKVKEGKN